MDSRKDRLRYLDGITQVPADEHENRHDDIQAALLDADKERPGHIFFVEKVDDFSRAIKTREKEVVLRDVLQGIFQHPGYLEGFFDTLEKLSVLDQKKAINAETMQKELEVALEKIIKKERMGVTEEHIEVMDRWLELYTKSEKFKPVVSRLLRASLDVGKSELLSAQRKHVLGESLLRSSDRDVLVAGVEILMFDTDVVPNTPDNLDQYLAGIMSTDDKILQLSLDNDAIIDFLGKRFSPEGFQRFSERMDDFARQMRQEDTTGGRRSRFFDRSLENSRTERGRAVIAFHDFVNGRSVADVNDLDSRKYPFYLIMDPNHMTSARRLFNKKMAMEMNRETGLDYVRIFSPKQGEVVTEIPERYEDIRDMLIQWFAENGGTQEITDDLAFETLQYLFPKVEGSVRADLAKRVFSLKGKLKNDLRQLVSPKGDTVVVDDPFLNSLGIKEISFTPRASAVDLDVKIRVGEYICRCRIDGYYTLRHATRKKDTSLDISTDATLIFSEAILSQLQILLCSQKEMHRGERGARKEKEDTGTVRRAHLRHLPRGQSFTTAQAARTFEKYGIDLWTLNSQLGLGKEEGTYTCVKAVELGDSKHTEPIETTIHEGSQLSSIFS